MAVAVLPSVEHGAIASAGPEPTAMLAVLKRVEQESGAAIDRFPVRALPRQLVAHGKVVQQ